MTMMQRYEEAAEEPGRTSNSAVRTMLIMLAMLTIEIGAMKCVAGYPTSGVPPPMCARNTPSNFGNH